ncbi:MAG: UPF0182 family protein [Bifidobacteriaceae bacterium]|jgi:uncharacterized membrane protein (UPF0182 family)|nr:UPF0182 family protein [Bifidobacteriaceae bacterium]
MCEDWGVFSINFPPRPPRQPSNPTPRQPRGKPLRRSPVAWTVGILAVLALALYAASQIWTEVLWFKQINFLQVFTTQWIARIALFLAGFLVMGIVVWAAVTWAYRSRPVYAPTTDSEQVVGRYRDQFEPIRRYALIGIPAALGLFAAGNAAGRWETVLLALNSEPFGEVDPRFGLDIGFYVFQLPAIRFGVSFLMGVVLISLIAAMVIQYLYGGISLVGGTKPRLSKPARIQLGIGAAVFSLLIGVQYFLDRYSMLSQVNADGSDGAGYTAIHANIPAKLILACIAVFVAALFAVAAWRGDWKLPATGLGLMVLSAVVVGWAYPALIQNFSVKPNELDKERQYIQWNIEATRYAFGIDDVEVSAYNAETGVDPAAIRADADSTAQIRLLDPTVVSPTFRQREQNKQYYDFPQVLSVDRYEIEGEKQDTVIAVRDLKVSGIDNPQWVNLHTVYTHGYGVAAAYGNTTDDSGWPEFFEGGIPAAGALEVEEPRVYFGTTSPTYSIVGGGQDAKPVELDYPSDATEAGGEVYNTYAGNGGPNVGSLLNKVLYAIRFGSTNILFSSNVRPESQILYDRDPFVRVQKVAPYLTLDERVYPAVVDGRIVWIVDGYTTTDSYPYSEHQSLSSAALDSISTLNNVAGINSVAAQTVNYLRNSVKAVVDAYDGTVTLYAWDVDDPVLKAWTSIYSTSLEPIADISGDLMSHLRYPETLFKVQRTMLARYHVTNAGSFFGGQDFWKTPNDPTKEASIQQPPYYLTLKMPTQEEAVFSLSSTYIPAGSTSGGANILKGFLAVDSETGSTAGEVAADYGKMRLLQLPQGTSIAGPGQIQTTFETNDKVKNQIRLLQDAGTEVVRGNLLTLPVGGGLLYVQPLYVQATSGTALPALRKVVVGFGDDRVGIADTLAAALNDVEEPAPTVPEDTTGGDESSGAEPPASPSPSPSASASPSPSESAGGGGAISLDQAIDDALKAMDAADAAMKAGDWDAWAQAQKDLQAARQALEAARNSGAT